MMTYLEDGHCSISNNLSENAIRPITVGRRNWLFRDSTDGADASMMIYSLLETARSNSLNPQKYLKYLLEARPNKTCLAKNLKIWHSGVLKSNNAVLIGHKVRESGDSPNFSGTTPYYSALTL